jgi:putative hemolysin
MNDALRIVVVLLLILGNAIFVAAEYALVTARRGRLEERAEKGGRSARVALKLMDEPVRLISTVQIAITVFGIALGSIGEPVVSEYFGFLPRGLAFAIAFVILTYLSVALGELIPKALALQKAEGIAIGLAVPINVLAKFLYPVVWVLQHSAAFVLKLFGVKPAPAGMITYTREDILQSVAAAEDVGEIEQAEEEMLYKVFKFGGKEVEDVMVPKPQLIAISDGLSTAEILAAVVDSPYTRYPVYHESLDDILGVLHVRDLFKAIHEHGVDGAALASILRPAYVVPETKDLAALLADFRRTKQHMAVVVDEYGATQGLVTLEDVLEEIVGEIEDEFDLPDTRVERIDDDRIRIDGTFTIDDFNEQFGTDLDHEDYNTMAGLVFGRLGQQPHVGDTIHVDGLVLTVLAIDGNRINRLEIEFRVAPAEDDDTDEDDAPREATG